MNAFITKIKSTSLVVQIRMKERMTFMLMIFITINGIKCSNKETFLYQDQEQEELLTKKFYISLEDTRRKMETITRTYSFMILTEKDGINLNNKLAKDQARELIIRLFNTMGKCMSLEDTMEKPDLTIFTNAT